MPDQTITVSLTQQRDYQFTVVFSGGVPDLLADEPAPLGTAQGPSPVQLLAAAVGNCLSDSLLFALRKYKQSPEPRPNLSPERTHHVLKASGSSNESPGLGHSLEVMSKSS